MEGRRGEVGSAIRKDRAAPLHWWRMLGGISFVGVLGKDGILGRAREELEMEMADGRSESKSKSRRPSPGAVKSLAMCRNRAGIRWCW